MRKTNNIYLHTGSNLGDRKSNLEKANQLITARIGDITAQSGFYKTKAWGITEQPDFINQALEVETKLSPRQVMDSVLEIEKQMGRKRNGKWTSRLIDIDILFYGEEIIEEEHLTIPHPHLQERNFVLVPLQEIAGDFIHPVLKLSIKDLVNQSKDALEVTAY